MCDMQNMPTSDDACEEEEDMNFATFSTAGPTAGTNFVAAGTQMPVAKLQQGVAGNGLEMMVVGGMDVNGVQYIRTMDAGNTVGSLQSTPHLITLPIALPGSKPGDPQQTVQIQVLNPNLGIQQHQQPKFMQIPIQSFQQGGTVLTVAYSPEANEGFQLLQGPEGIQVIMPQDMQMLQQENKEQVATSLAQQIYVQNQQIVVNSAPDKMLNNNTSSNNNNQNINMEHIIIKEECDDITNDDESSQGTEGTNDSPWQDNQSISSYILHTQPKLPQQQTLPVSLQQFLRLNSTEKEAQPEPVKNEDITEAVLTDDGTIKIKKKRKYKKRPPKPARPKPGQVIIATSNDGTTIFCCPECQMAFPEKLQLEMHLSVHKIERRFICGICGAGLKRKEHLERHKLGHNPERPYVCAVCRKGFKRREHLNLHTVIHSGVKTEVCLECGKGFYRKDHLRKHTRSHVSKRAREGTAGVTNTMSPGLESVTITKTETVDSNISNTIMPEITIHVPTSANVQVPVQINIPQHVVSSLAAQQAAQANSNNNSNNILDALLAQHT